MTLISIQLSLLDPVVERRSSSERTEQDSLLGALEVQVKVLEELEGVGGGCGRLKTSR